MARAASERSRRPGSLLIRAPLQSVTERGAQAPQRRMAERGQFGRPEKRWRRPARWARRWANSALALAGIQGLETSPSSPRSGPAGPGRAYASGPASRSTARAPGTSDPTDQSPRCPELGTLPQHRTDQGGDADTDQWSGAPLPRRWRAVRRPRAGGSAARARRPAAAAERPPPPEQAQGRGGADTEHHRGGEEQPYRLARSRSSAQPTGRWHSDERHQ